MGKRNAGDETWFPSPAMSLYKSCERSRRIPHLVGRQQEHKSPLFHVTSTMPVRKAIAEKDGVYFMTFTCINWLPLFKTCNAYDAVYNSCLDDQSDRGSII